MTAREDDVAALRRTFAAILREAAAAIEIDEDSRVEARVAPAPGAELFT